MLRRYPYFEMRRSPGGDVPEPLRICVERRVRFEEVDAMGIVWHGRYPSYFEDARVALGIRLGIGYDTLVRERVPAPIKQLFIEHFAPLRFGQFCRIDAALHWSEAARMNMAYAIRTLDGILCASGYSVQLFTDADGELLLEPPGFYREFLRAWRGGEFIP